MLSGAREAIRRTYRVDETEVAAALLAGAPLDPVASRRVRERAGALIEAMRRHPVTGVEQFLREYRLSTPEGVVLMCLAEALLRIPDTATADRLIRDKLGSADWQRHLGQSPSLLVNASTWALMLTGRILGTDEITGGRPARDILDRLVTRSGEPMIRAALQGAMRVLGRQFVMGRTIDEALERARPAERFGYRHSYDMLGEGARTAADAERYLERYRAAIANIGRAARPEDPIAACPSISVKLSALHPRYEFAQIARVRRELIPRVVSLAEAARDAGIGLTIDAEESERLEPSLDVVAALAGAPSLRDWDGLGLAVQAYQKRARATIAWIEGLGAATNRRLAVRLVKGAYWDSEIKRTQQRGLDGYAVFTRKGTTDVSYLVCAAAMLASPHIYSAFATHNAMSLAAVLELAGPRTDWEFQRLHGMAEALYHDVVGKEGLGRPCRVYAPVGGHEDLLPYLVRRLLENGANTSFVNQVADPDAPVETLTGDPVARLADLPIKPHPHIPLPRDLYGRERINSRGIDLSDADAVAALLDGMQREWTRRPEVRPPANGAVGQPRPVTDPADRRRIIGLVTEAGVQDAAHAMTGAVAFQRIWSAVPVGERAAALERAGDAIEADRVGMIALLVREGGKTLPDAVAEVREAVDYCRYYAAAARRDFAPQLLPGPTGEDNSLSLAGRGVFVCISPWNFPLAIFIGQIAAALAAGNTVIAKPAPQTPLIAARAVAVLHGAGVPAEALRLLPGGPELGAALVAHPAVAGVAFTGSTGTAQAINRALAARNGPIATLIAETGGMNAIIADNSALAEQLVDDVVASSFLSAGQRCSACRLLFLPEEVASRTVEMLAGALDELVIGDPGLLATDVGPVIDEAACARLEAHLHAMGNVARLVARAKLPPGCENGTFFAPAILELDRADRLTSEVFGPILHVVRYRAGRLDQVIDTINALGYGLTLGVHSRIGATIEAVRHGARVGNLYVNRSIIGATVGVQPFGGEGLSGTGPKAGGPSYVRRFAVERTVSVDTTSAGGNTTLLSLPEDN